MTSDEDMRKRVETDEPFRERLIAWVRANGLSETDIPSGERPSVADGMLTTRVFARNARGGIQIDPVEEKVMTRTVTVPVVVEPTGDVAEWLRPRRPECGR